MNLLIILSLFTINVLGQSIETRLSDNDLLQRIGNPNVSGIELDGLLDDLLTRDVAKLSLEIKTAMQRRIIFNDLPTVAHIASYKDLCAKIFPGGDEGMKLDFSDGFKPTLGLESERNSWSVICGACHGKGANFQRLCDSITSLQVN